MATFLITIFYLLQIRLFIENCTEDVKISVYCLMRKLMTNKLANKLNFNLKGTNREGARLEKRKFHSTKSYGVIIGKIFIIYIHKHTFNSIQF